MLQSKKLSTPFGETFKAMEKEQSEGFSSNSAIYPVIRSTSFPRESAAGQRFIIKDHTAETRIYYALDLGTTYRLIDESMLEPIGLSERKSRNPLFLG